MDNNATVRIRGSPIRLMLALAKLIKDTTNCLLPSGFQILWKHIVEKMLWYNFEDYQRLSTIVTPRPKQCLEEVMLHYHKKVGQMLKDQRRSCLTHSCSTRQKPPSTPIASEAPVEGQFDDLGQDPYDPLKTPTDTPIQDETIMPIQDDTLGDMTMSNAVTEEENRLLDNEGDNVSIVSSQGKRRPANLTSLMYQQEELSNHGDIVNFLLAGVTP